jgi:flagellar biosynthesis/type III secretory pathway protein FliH
MDIDTKAPESDILQEATDLESKYVPPIPSLLSIFPAWAQTLHSIKSANTSFFQQGYQDGHAHGQLHGLFEGRELGKEKAFEIWEELGYYEGWAGLFLSNLKQTGKEGRYVNPQLPHIDTDAVEH